MTAVLDTSILIDHLRGDQRAQALLTDLVKARKVIAASTMTRVDILAGMRHDEKRATLRLLSLLEWIPVDTHVADRAGELARQYFRSHPGVDPVDYVVAATVDQLDADLYTRNVKHFPMFAGLQPPYA